MVGFLCLLDYLWLRAKTWLICNRTVMSRDGGKDCLWDVQSGGASVTDSLWGSLITGTGRACGYSVPSGFHWLAQGIHLPQAGPIRCFLQGTWYLTWKSVILNWGTWSCSFLSCAVSSWESCCSGSRDGALPACTQILQSRLHLSVCSLKTKVYNFCNRHYDYSYTTVCVCLCVYVCVYTQCVFSNETKLWRIGRIFLKKSQ